jgi:molybdenum cofactor synthesis domain-containing protein
MATTTVETAAFLAIGNELLSGKVVEANLPPLAKTLRSLGVELRTAEILPDEIEILAPAILRLSRAHGVVVTSGGVGPTHDDVTIEAVAKAFERRVVRAPALVELVRGTFGDATTEAHLRFADVPEGAELRRSADASWPTPVVENVWILPGVPEVFRMKLGALRASITGPRPFLSRALVLTVDEVDLKDSLDAVVAAHPLVTIGSYPALFNPRYRTRITFDGTNAASLDAALDDLRARLDASAVVDVE